MQGWRLLGIVGVTVAVLSGAQAALASHCTQVVPLGGVAPQRPIWCFFPLADGTDTHVSSGNNWLDDFNHGNTFADLNPAYVEGFFGNGTARHFQHNNHWMVDVESQGNGALIGAWMRPDKAFRPQADGWTIIEFEVAVPIVGTRGIDQLSDSWPELVLSTAPNPPGMQSWGSFLRRNGTYLYEAFPGAWTFGCRMQQSKHPICALYRDDFGTAGTKPSRVWEINQNGGEVRFEEGGGPPAVGSARDLAWRGCTELDDPDVECRNVFRFEIRADEIRIIVNGVPYYRAGLIDSNMNNILQASGGFYVFMGDFAYRFNPGKPLRFHWDHLAINPSTIAAVTPTPGVTSGPTLQPATSTPTHTAVPTATSTPVPATGTAVLATPTSSPTLVPTATLTPIVGGGCQTASGVFPNGGTFELTVCP